MLVHEPQISIIYRGVVERVELKKRIKFGLVQKKKPRPVVTVRLVIAGGSKLVNRI